MTDSPSQPRIYVEAWGSNDWVITINGRPLGQSITSRFEATSIAKWLRTSITDIWTLAPKQDSTT